MPKPNQGNTSCTLEQVVFGMMFASDETLLTNFGDAKLWLGYLCSGNDTKYFHCQSSLNSCEHVGYFQVVSFYYHNGIACIGELMVVDE